MQRRTLLAALTATLLMPAANAVAGSRPPKTVLRFGARVTHRRLDVTRKKVKLRFALYHENMARDPIWDEVHSVNIEEGRFSVELGKGSMGTALEDPFPEKLYLGVFVLEMGPEVSDLRLTPKLRLEWATSGTAACIENQESLNDGGLDEGGVCTLAGDGKVAMYVTELQRVPAAGTWVAD